jgi:hypothetical protein
VKARTLCIAGLVLFGLLSLLDLYLTWQVIQRSGRIHEGNPIAGAWLRAFGWQGLVVFKIAAMTVLAASILILYRRRPATATAVVLFACLAVGSVALYSRQLYLHPPVVPRDSEIAPD